eukprot:Platyproteum_vivax@DN12810_c0_g1_i1.p1
MGLGMSIAAIEHAISEFTPALVLETDEEISSYTTTRVVAAIMHIYGDQTANPPPFKLNWDPTGYWLLDVLKFNSMNNRHAEYTHVRAYWVLMQKPRCRNSTVLQALTYIVVNALHSLPCYESPIDYSTNYPYTYAV